MWEMNHLIVRGVTLLSAGLLIVSIGAAPPGNHQAETSCPPATELGWEYLEEFLTDQHFAPHRQRIGIPFITMDSVHPVTNVHVCAALANESPTGDERETSYFEGGGWYFVTHTFPMAQPGVFPMYIGLNYVDVVSAPNVKFVEGFAW